MLVSVSTIIKSDRNILDIGKIKIILFNRSEFFNLNTFYIQEKKRSS